MKNHVYLSPSAGNFPLDFVYFVILVEKSNLILLEIDQNIFVFHRRLKRLDNITFGNIKKEFLCMLQQILVSYIIIEVAVNLRAKIIVLLIELKWIKAHDGSLWNEYADALASTYMRR